MTAIMGGEALLGQGFAATACLDTSQGQPGVRLTGTFNPQRADSLGRYGINIDRPGISFIPEQYTGAHSTGLNSQAVALLPQVFAKLGVIIEPNATRDQADLDMLVGATAWVIRMAIDFKLLAPAAPPVDPPAPPPAPPPVHPPSPPPVAPPPAGSGLHPLSPASVRADELRSLAVFTSDTVAWWLPDNWHKAFTEDWLETKPFVVEALRVWRRLRAKLGDTREIPAEDR